jgi:hypothetical protein
MMSTTAIPRSENSAKCATDRVSDPPTYVDIRRYFGYIRHRISLIEGRLREGTFGSGASAVPPRGLATRTGAALGIIPFGITAEA